MSSTLSFDEVPSHDFNVTVSKDEFLRNPNLYFDAGDITWMMISSALVFLMVPGSALFNSGISGRNSAVSMMFLPLLTAGVLGLQWWLWGYSITFASADNPFWGSADSFTLHKVLAAPSGNDSGRKIPELVFALYQCMFACFTGALVSGCVVKKGRFVPFLVFVIIWSTLVYDPIARWTWSPEGWSNRWGTLDFAGGTVVHICAATTAATYSVFFRIRGRLFRGRGFHVSSIELRERSQSPQSTEEPRIAPRPQREHGQNMTRTIIGTVFLWIGWFGFNGGSALGANLRAVSACISTFLAGCAGGVTWSLLDYVLVSLAHALRNRRAKGGASQEAQGSFARFSVQGFCNGVVAGLVAITPAAGYVPCRSSPLFGVVAAVVCSLSLSGNFISYRLLDTLNIFVIHAIGGWVGMILTAVFAKGSVAQLDGYTQIPGGWLDHNWKQIGIQICDAAAGMAYAGGVTLIILLLMETITFICFNRRMDNGHEVTDADDMIKKELL